MQKLGTDPLTLVLLALGLAASPPAAADAKSAGPPSATGVPAVKPKSFFPPGMNLADLPVGTWCDYQMRVNNGPPRRQRIAIVARQNAEVTVEVDTAESKDDRGQPRYILMLKIDASPGAPATIRQRLMRTGQAFPKELPSRGPLLAFSPLDDESALGMESTKLRSVQVPARRHRRAWGDAAMEVWINEKISPCGLVRSRESGPTAERLVEMEFVETGKGATSQMLAR